MFIYQDERCYEFENYEPDLVIVINSFEIDSVKDSCTILSQKLKEIFKNSNKDTLIFNIDGIDISEYILEIKYLFQGKEVHISNENAETFSKLSEYFEIDSLSSFLSDLIFDESILDTYFFNNTVINDFLNLEAYILSLSKENNIQKLARECISLIQKIGKDVFIKTTFLLVSQLQTINFSVIFILFEEINQDIPDIFDEIIKFVKSEMKHDFHKKHLFFIIRQLYERNYIFKEDIQSMFIKRKYPFILKDIFEDISYLELNNFNIDLHRKGCFEGQRPELIFSLIRDDNVDGLQMYYGVNHEFHANQKLSPCKYEKSPFINDGDCSIIEYSAFFGSEKCFSYFIMNEEKINYSHCMKYAIAGGNLSIIRLILQYGIIPQNMASIAIQFHKHYILEWLIKNAYDKISRDLFNQTMKNFNFKSFLFIIGDGFSLFDFLISTIFSNNLLLFKHSLNILSDYGKQAYLNQRKTFVFILVYKIYLIFIMFQFFL